MANDHVTVEPGSALWDDGWGKLLQCMKRELREYRRREWKKRMGEAWRTVKAGLAADEPSPSVVVALRTLVNGVPFQEISDNELMVANDGYGECWQHMDCWYGEYIDGMTGESKTGWFHDFRHRNLAMVGKERVYVKFGVDPGVLPEQYRPEPAPEPLAGDSGLPF